MFSTLLLYRQKTPSRIILNMGIYKVYFDRNAWHKSFSTQSSWHKWSLGIWQNGKRFSLSPVYRDGTKVLVCKWHALFPKLEDVCSAASRIVIHLINWENHLSGELFPAGPALLTAPAGWLRRKGHEKVNSFTAISWAILILSLKMDGRLQLNLLLIVHRRSWVVPGSPSIG